MLQGFWNFILRGNVVDLAVEPGNQEKLLAEIRDAIRAQGRATPGS